MQVAHTFHVIPDLEDGGYVIVFPDLHGCMTQIESLEELAEMVQEAYELWIEEVKSTGSNE